MDIMKPHMVGQYKKAIFDRVMKQTRHVDWGI